jgi:hypothetical protein
LQSSLSACINSPKRGGLLRPVRSQNCPSVVTSYHTPAFQLVAEALRHKYQESLAPTGDKHKLEHILRTIKDIQGPVTLAAVRALRAARLLLRRHMTTTAYKLEVQKREARTAALKKMTSEQHVLF